MKAGPEVMGKVGSREIAAHNAGATERGQEAPRGENDGRPHVNGKSQG